MGPGLTPPDESAAPDVGTGGGRELHPWLRLLLRLAWPTAGLGVLLILGGIVVVAAARVLPIDGLAALISPMIWTFGAGAVLIAVGLSMYVLAPGFFGHAAASMGYGSHRLVLAAVALVVLLGNLLSLPYHLGRPDVGLCTVPGFVTAASGVQAALLIVMWGRFIRPGVISWRDLGVSGTALFRYSGTGLLVGVAVLICSAAVQLSLDRLGVHQTQIQSFRCIREFPISGFAAVVLTGGILAPFAEELFFRGFVFRSYLQTRGALFAYPASAVLFASLHLNLPALLPILVMGLLFAWVYQRTGSVLPSVVGHAVNNSAAFSILYFADLAV
ncbi:MAG: CPBP family intramembrane glutamic endopeptidase [Chloroflexota bacterium]